MSSLKDIKRSLGARIRPLINAQRARSPFFKKFPANGTVHLVNSRTLIDLQRRFVYSRVPKAANSTIVASLYLDAQDGEQVDSVEHLKKGRIAPAKLSERQVNEIVANFTKFTFVRNPYMRVLSCYLDKFTRPHMVGDIARQAMGLPNDAEVTFSRFLDFISTESGRQMDAHWARQTEIMAFPVVSYDFIGTVETIDTDLPELLALLKLSRPVTHFAPHRTKSKEMLDTLSSDDLRRIREIYSPDFDDLGYDPNPSNPIRIGHRAL